MKYIPGHKFLAKVPLSRKKHCQFIDKVPYVLYNIKRNLEKIEGTKLFNLINYTYSFRNLHNPKDIIVMDFPDCTKAEEFIEMYSQ